MNTPAVSNWKVSGILGMLLVGNFAACTPKSPSSHINAVGPAVTDLHAVPFEQRETNTSFVAEGRNLEVVFLDIGDDIGLILRAAGNTLVHVDVNRDGQSTPRVDRSFGLDFDTGRACSWYTDATSGPCEGATAATGAKTAKNERWEVAFRIPKAELGPSKSDALVMFEVYPVSGAEPSVRFPAAAPFQKVFRLIYARSGKPIGVPDDWPGASNTPTDPPPPNPPAFGTTRRNFYLGEQVCIVWDVPNAQKVTLEPGLGDFDAKGRHCFSPDKSMTITLRASGPDGVVEKTQAIQLIDVEIKSFTASPKRVRLGDSFALEWHVKGATSLGLERSGSSGNSGSTFDSSVTSSNTKIRVNATRKEFDAPGHYIYKLRADGPGGPKFKTTEIDIVP